MKELLFSIIFVGMVAGLSTCSSDDPEGLGVGAQQLQDAIDFYRQQAEIERLERISQKGRAD